MDTFHTAGVVGNHLPHSHVLGKHYPLGANNFGDIDLHAFDRIVILGATGILAATYILLMRLFSTAPFFPPKDYRSYKIVNKKDFLYLYSTDELPSKAPVEPLDGARLGWAYCSATVLIGLLLTTSIQLATRVLHESPFNEEIGELAFYGFLTSLWGLRFCVTPYRNTLYNTVALSCVVPILLGLERDVWPKLLFHPKPSQLADIRDGILAIIHLGLQLLLPLTFLLTPRVWYPVDPYDEKEVASPEQTASVASFILSYSWIGNLVVKAFRKNIEPEDLPPIPDYDRGKLWAQKILKDQRKSTLRTLLFLMRYDLGFMLVASFASGACKFISPIAMRKLLAHIEGSKEPTVTPWVYVAQLFVGTLLANWCYEFYIFNSTRLIVRVKAALTQSLLMKTMKIRLTSSSSNDTKNDSVASTKNVPQKDTKKDSTAHQQSKVGMINNLVSTDLENLTESRDIFLLMGSVPIELTFAVIFLYDLLGWASLVGIAMMLASMVVPAFTAKVMARIQTNARKATDARIGVMNEVLKSIRIIKFFGLENAFMDKIKEKRETELGLQWKTSLYSLSFYCITSLLPVMNMLVALGIYTNVMNKPLTASTTFTSLILFGILRGQFSWVAFIVKQLLYAGISFQRIDDFLHKEEELEETSSSQTLTQTDPTAVSRTVGFKNATLSWAKPGSEEDSGFRLSALDVECTLGGLTVVSGPVGSGKTSFILGLLGEMRLLQGEIRLPRHQGVAYVSQSPWLQNATIKDNILFGSEYDEKRYTTVLEACALTTDLQMFESGDETEVGERGVTLSGGQKARLALARAVYSPTDIVILDDVLSALDSGTIKLVVERCINGEILKNRTVILVTHHVSLVASSADQIIVLDDGTIVSAGPPSLLPDLISNGSLDSSEPMEAEQLTKLAAETLVLEQTSQGSADAPTKSTKDPKKGKLVLEEERAEGRVPKSMVLDYLRQLGGPFILGSLVVLCIVLELAGIANTIFVGLWADAYRKPDVNPNAWLAGYAALLCGMTVINSLSGALWNWSQMGAARTFHERLVKAVLYAPIRFFDTTPIGRIINRFSKDVGSIDGSLSPYIQTVFRYALDISLSMVVLSGLVPTFLIPTIFVAVIGCAVGEMYLRAQMGVKRIVSVRESPLISHFNDTINGVITIRAFSCQKRFLDENLQRIDNYTLPQQTLYNLNRWVSVRINALTAFVALCAGAIAVKSTHLPPGLIGFSLSNALGFSMKILYAVKYFNTLEVELNSLERVNEYIKLEQETPATSENQPPASWPTEGDVKVRNLSVRYSEDGPDVLHKLSFDIKPRERVGVVGRTGAGKSSLALSLLRFTVKSEGSIIISGRDIENVNLDALRQRITIIPQDPVLFSGTIRSNLDPLGEIDDSELQWALNGSGLTSMGDGTDSGIGSESTSGTATPVTQENSTGTKKITLDTQISAGGENLSQGQRQLLAFARALVRRSKLVILDEATSSTDHRTDERIQRTLKTSFPDSSIVCIAHRLRTVMNFDKILVLDNKGNGGEVVEFDTPANLLQKEGGVLYDLAKKSGEYDELLALATATE